MGNNNNNKKMSTNQLCIGDKFYDDDSNTKIYASTPTENKPCNNIKLVINTLEKQLKTYLETLSKEDDMNDDNIKYIKQNILKIQINPSVTTDLTKNILNIQEVKRNLAKKL